MCQAYLCWICERGDLIGRDRWHCVDHEVRMRNADSCGYGDDERREMHVCDNYQRRTNDVQESQKV
jgi:hypothetical protein